MWRIILKDLVIVLIVATLLVVTLPIFAGEIDEDNNKDEYLRIKTALPENETVLWSGVLPEIEDKVKIKKIVIDLSEQKLFTYENDELTGEYLVSTGKPGMPTPVGDFQIHERRDRAWSSYGLWMPYWMLIDLRLGVGIHELPEWPSGYKEGVDHLGTPVSHGCIRLGVGPAEMVYNWVEIGTKVIVQK